MKFSSRQAMNSVAVAAALIVGLSACASDTPPGQAAADGKPTQDDVIEAAPVADEVPSSPVLDRIKDNGVVHAGGNGSRPLFNQLNPTNKKYEGFEAGLTYMFAKYVLGEPKVEFSGTTVVNREALLQNGTVDFLAGGYSVTPERAQKVNFAGPYLRSGVAVGIPADADGSSVDDLAGKKVGTLSGLAENAVIDAAPDAEPVVFSSAAEVVQGMLTGHADAIAIDQPSLLGAISKHPDEIKLLQDEPIQELYFGIGLNKDDPELKKFTNEWLEEINKSGEYQKLWEATVGDIMSAPTMPEIGSVPGS